MDNIVELVLDEQTQDLCPDCGAEVSLARMEGRDTIVCDCSGYLVA